MRTIYLDGDFGCHVSPGDGLAPVETDFFDGKCAAYIEGYRFVPAGETWVREDGTVFHGEMVAPWKPWQELRTAQLEYELEQLRAEARGMAEALSILEVTPDE